MIGLAAAAGEPRLVGVAGARFLLVDEELVEGAGDVVVPLPFGAEGRALGVDLIEDVGEIGQLRIDVGLCRRARCVLVLAMGLPT